MLPVFRFFREDIGKDLELCGWGNGTKNKNVYMVDAVAAVCVVMQNLPYPTIWTESERIFGKIRPR